MSKPTVRVIVSVLIGLVIVLAVFASVQAASSGAVRGQTHLTAGLMPDLSHQRDAVQKLQNYMPQTEPGHHCDDEGYNPSDD